MEVKDGNKKKVRGPKSLWNLANYDDGAGGLILRIRKKRMRDLRD